MKQFDIRMVVGFMLSLAVLAEPSMKGVGNPLGWLSAGGKNVPIYETLELTVTKADGSVFSENVFLTGYGIYSKKVGFFTVDVYLAQSFVSNPNKISRSNPMQSIQDSRAKVIWMTMMTDVTANQIRNSYEESLIANGIDLNRTGVQNALNTIRFGMRSGDHAFLVGVTENSPSEDLWLSVPSGSYVNTENGLASDFWRTWFGVSADSGLRNLKPQLMNR